ncbi:laccase LCC3-2 [Ephemerocybe angulata]|uniref:Laccase LCC3-2 n=1 Tax=Ephemerocybe angulata TaxID=980116 RepID=A0A8H6HGC8_9AGAR|nr:laccase LCC3-2 [Tulosesus angulatus]
MLRYIASAVLVAAFWSGPRLAVAVEVIGPTSEIRVTNVELAPDGFSRLAAVANGVHPGPLIKAHEGDRFKLNVANKLTDPFANDTSIHWHGFFQRGTTWADGAEGVSQCPIPTGSSFLYNFPSGGQTGTFWYHSHLGTQYCDGLRGPMVVYDKIDPYKHLYDVDDENTVITLADWFHLQSRELALNGAGASANSSLINGKGRYPDGPAVPLAVISVQKNKRYRFRLVSLSCDANFNFTIDGHKLTVIEADGQLVKPLVVDSIRIFAGQRYSFVLHANQSVSNYWIRAQPSTGFGRLPDTTEGGLNSAILRYAGAPDEDPKSIEVPSKLPLREPNLHPLLNPAPPGSPTFEMTLAIGFNGTKWSMNNVTWDAPVKNPILLQILTGAANASALLPKGSIYDIPRGATVELTVVASPIAAPHPFHLHGHAFSVVKSAESTEFNYVDPVRRDVVTTGIGMNTTVIRFVADNPGPWIFHCHIEFHLREGLAVVFAEAFSDILVKNPIPQSWRDLCKAYKKAQPDFTLP